MNTKLLGKQSRMLVSEPQFLIFHNKMLTIETAVSSARFVKQPFSQALGGGTTIPYVFTRTQSILILLGQQVENKDSSSFTN